MTRLDQLQAARAAARALRAAPVALRGEARRALAWAVLVDRTEPHGGRGPSCLMPDGTISRSRVDAMRAWLAIV